MSASTSAAGAEREPLNQRASRSIRHPLARTLVVLTFTTGLVDATSYLGLGHVFTANMTGNIVFLGFGIAGGSGLPVLAPLISLGAFLVGSGVGGVLAARMADRHPHHFACALTIEVSLIACAAVVAVAVDIRPDAISGDAVIALLALAMGVRNATIRRIAVPDLTTTVLTMTLTGLAGKLVAEAVAGTAERFDVFARIPHRDFPGGRLFRRPSLVMAMMYYRLRDLM